MAASSEQPPSAAPSKTQESVFQWLRNLPLAPEYHPTLAEFQDPIAYIFKIEKEASKYGICKIVPPHLPASKKSILSNLNKSLSSRPGSTSPPTFTTRQQQIGFCPRKPRPVQKSVWQSGESYTFQDFEAKAKGFERSYLKKYSKKQTLSSSALSPLEVETLYWKAAVDKPFSVEYANDMPGSAFPPWRRKEGVGVVADDVSVGDTEWNMRGASRAKGSLLRFMKEEIPGVTSPMVYIGMMFSWFAWHIEDHDLHSLNYMHMGAGKTWYGVPRDAAAAFEEVVRVHGYGGEINPLVMFLVLGEKTTVMSPEVFISGGVPCCRLVQNTGEFVVTFPRAYHSGFSHGFNCSEAANIATPEWLRVAKDAAIRRASINYPPMVSHFQLLYDLALELCTRVPGSISSKPRSSRLKDKQKGEGEALVKEQFVNNIIHNNDLLHILGKGSSIVLLPQISSDISVCSNLRVGSQLKDNTSFELCSNKDFVNSSKSTVPSNIMPERNHEIKQVKGFLSMKTNFGSLYERNRFASLNVNPFTSSANTGTGKGSDIHGGKLSDQRLFSCVTCGILSFECVAIIQPSEAAAQYLMSADCSFFNDWTFGSGVTSDGFAIDGGNANTSHQKPYARQMEKNIADGLYDVPVQSVYQIQMVDQSIKIDSDSAPHNQPSALSLLALNYGNSSDSEEEQLDPDASHEIEQINRTNCPESYYPRDSASPSFKEECHDDATCSLSSSRLNHEDEASPQPIGCFSEHGSVLANIKDRSDQNVDCSLTHVTFSRELNDLGGTCRDPMSLPSMVSECSPGVQGSERTKSGRAIIPTENTNTTSTQKSDEDSSRMHVFCLEHAVEVEQRLQKIGGVNVWLLCHPEYPRIEAEAKSVLEELGTDHLWNGITFRDANKEDEERIKSTLDSEEGIPGNGDWAVKLGINLFYSASLSRSPLYSKQMPYNSVIYNAFGRTSPSSSPTKFNVYGRRRSRQRKVVAGKWCGKVWMSNQVHSFLSKQDSKDHEQELEINSHGQAMSNEKLVRKLKSIPKSESSLVTRKYARKRKITAVIGSVKKAKCIETKDPTSDDSMEDNSRKLGPTTINGNRTKVIDREFSRDSSDDDCQQQDRRICKSKKTQYVERENDVSDDSSGENLNLQYMRILRDKRARLYTASFVAENNSQKQQVTASRSNEDNYFEERSVSDDLLLNTLRQWRGRFPKMKQTKLVENKEALSDDLLEEISLQPPGKVPSSQKINCIEKEDRFSDNSLVNISSQQKRRISKYHKAKHTEMAHAISDDSPDESTREHKGFPRSIQAKLMESEDAVMDDSLDDYTYHQHTRILRCKQTRYIEREDVDPVNGPPSKAHQQQRRISRSRNTQFSKSEDAISDDLLGGQTPQQHRKPPRGKKGSVIGKDVVDNLQQNSLHQLRKTPRRNPAEFKETEDAASGDLEDTSNQQRKRVLRSSHNKQITLRQLKRETPRVIKGTPQVMKEETPQSIQLEKQLKQEKPQLRTGKSQPNTRQFESHVEELEGGPSTRLRKRPSKPQKVLETKPKMKQQTSGKKEKNVLPLKAQAGRKNVRVKGEGSGFHCDIEGCTMGFRSKQELAMHKKNICPVKGCAKKFFSHKYLLQHRRVHIDDRPLKCPWKGCKMSFKWAWARTEHIRVHTGARPYVCTEEGCGQTFRFVSDFSRHKRKTGHSIKKTRC